MPLDSSCIVASIPGRLRVRHHHLKNSGQLEKLGAAFIDLDSSCLYQANARAGSLVLFYDAKQRGKAEMESAAAGIVNAMLTDSGASDDRVVMAIPAIARPAKNRRTLLRKANRYSKYVMYAGLGSSLALAARGAKFGHAVAGAVFVAALGVHLAVHRKHLFS